MDGTFSVRGHAPAGALLLRAIRDGLSSCDPVPFAVGDHGLQRVLSEQAAAVPVAMPVRDSGELRRSNTAGRRR
jgi:hypothetical protein